METVSRCVECGGCVAEGKLFCDSLCKRDCEKREAREEADARAPYEGFDDDWTDGGRRSDAEGRL